MQKRALEHITDDTMSQEDRITSPGALVKIGYYRLHRRHELGKTASAGLKELKLAARSGNEGFKGKTSPRCWEDF